MQIYCLSNIDLFMRKTWHLNQLFLDFYHISRTKTLMSYKN
ncbi:hypothetical protein [Weissella cibaria]|nr:hypothetical protein [Weissella cibaria]